MYGYVHGLHEYLMVKCIIVIHIHSEAPALIRSTSLTRLSLERSALNHSPVWTRLHDVGTSWMKTCRLLLLFLFGWSGECGADLRRWNPLFLSEDTQTSGCCLRFHMVIRATPVTADYDGFVKLPVAVADGPVLSLLAVVKKKQLPTSWWNIHHRFS